MAANRAETLKNEIHRIQQGISNLFCDSTPAGRRARKALFRPRLTTRDVMQTELSTVRPDALLGPAVATMIEQQVHSLPVVDGEGRIVGALNEKDLLKVFYEPEAMTVASVMTSDPIVMSIDTPLVDVIDQLISTDFRRVLIHERGRLVGVIVRTHLMPTILAIVEEAAAGRTPSGRSSH